MNKTDLIYSSTLMNSVNNVWLNGIKWRGCKRYFDHLLLTVQVTRPKALGSSKKHDPKINTHWWYNSHHQSGFWRMKYYWSIWEWTFFFLFSTILCIDIISHENGLRRKEHKTFYGHLFFSSKQARNFEENVFLARRSAESNSFLHVDNFVLITVQKVS